MTTLYKGGIMGNQEYLEFVRNGFGGKALIKENTTDTLVTYEEVFKWSWIATKLKIFSFVNFVETIELDTIKEYSSKCLKRAIKEKHGLPRGFQNGVLSYNVLVCNYATPEAIAFVTKQPNKHYSAFEVPIIFDVSNSQLHYYQGDIVWGMVYNSFIKEYIYEHFNPVKLT